MKSFNHKQAHTYHAGGTAMKSGLHMVKQGSVIVPPQHVDSLFEGEPDASLGITASPKRTPASTGNVLPQDSYIQNNKKLTGKAPQKMAKNQHASVFFGSNS